MGFSFQWRASIGLFRFSVLAAAFILGLVPVSAGAQSFPVIDIRTACDRRHNSETEEAARKHAHAEVTGQLRLIGR